MSYAELDITQHNIWNSQLTIAIKNIKDQMVDSSRLKEGHWISPSWLVDELSYMEMLKSFFDAGQKITLSVNDAKRIIRWVARVK